MQKHCVQEQAILWWMTYHLMHDSSCLALKGQKGVDCGDWLSKEPNLQVRGIRVILELPEREKFCNNFRISGRSFGPNFGFPHTLYTFSLLLQFKIGEVSQLREAFSPKSPSRMTPGV